jgi:hypothetical protein
MSVVCVRLVAAVLIPDVSSINMHPIKVTTFSSVANVYTEKRSDFIIDILIGRKI